MAYSNVQHAYRACLVEYRALLVEYRALLVEYRALLVEYRALLTNLVTRTAEYVEIEFKERPV